MMKSTLEVITTASVVLCASQTAIEYAAAYQMSVEETAEVLADAYLKGLLAAHHDARAESAAAWTPAGFISCTEVRPLL